MNTPIIDPQTLTNRQKERIKELYIQSEHNRMLEGLFGEEFFKEEE